MPNTIQHKRSTTASAVPSGASLSAGEIAINTADGRLFIKKSDGTVVAIGRDASELNTGTVAAARLPAATGSTLGAIIVGTGLSVASGTVQVSYGSTSSSACVGNDSRLSDARTPLSHTHGNLTNAGAIGSLSGQIVVTTTGGVLTTASTIAAGSVSGLATSATTDTTNASNISSGTLNSARLPSIGNITNAGAIGSTANLPVITTTSGVLTTGAFGTAANSFCQGNDSRLSDARTPLSHTHGNITNAGAIGSTANLPVITTTSGVLATGSFGSSAATFCEGSDPRLALKAWVCFDGTANSNLTGTYSQVGSTITITVIDHGFVAGQIVQLDFTSGTGTDNTVTISSVTSSSVFVVPAGDSKTTSGNVTVLRNSILGQYGVSSVTDNGAGSHLINFTTALSDTNYAVLAFSSLNAAQVTVNEDQALRAVGYVAVKVFTSAAALTDRTRVSVAVFR